jgi:hypothetical protein
MIFDEVYKIKCIWEIQTTKNLLYKMMIYSNRALNISQTFKKINIFKKIIILFRMISIHILYRVKFYLKN